MLASLKQLPMQFTKHDKENSTIDNHIVSAAELAIKNALKLLPKNKQYILLNLLETIITKERSAK